MKGRAARFAFFIRVFDRRGGHVRPPLALFSIFSRSDFHYFSIFSKTSSIVSPCTIACNANNAPVYATT
jgi:hypothetical protein